MDDVQFLISDPGHQGDEIEFATQRNQQRGQRCGHQSSPDSQWRGAISATFTIVWSDRERHRCKDGYAHKQKAEHPERRQTQAVSHAAMQTAVGNEPPIRLELLQHRRLPSLDIPNGRLRIAIQGAEIDQNGEEDENCIVPCQPVAVVELSVE